MRKYIILAGFLIVIGSARAQTPDNTRPGNPTPSNINVTPPPPVQSSTIFTNPPNHANPTGTGGTDMTNPNQNGSYESNPDGKPRDSFQSNPNTTPTNTRVPKTERRDGK